MISLLKIMKDKGRKNLFNFDQSPKIDVALVLNQLVRHLI